jgi:two-component system response regulator AtoC
MGSILLVDDEEKILKTLGRALRDDGHEVITASNGRDAQRLLAERSCDLMIIDFLMPDRTGMDVLRELAASTPEPERPAVVMMTAHGSIESAVEAMKLGARDYLQKPFEVDELLVLARRALEDQRARTGLRYLLSERDAEFNHYGIIGKSRAILDVIARAELVAESSMRGARSTRCR